MAERTYHLSVEEMDEFVETLVSIMEPYETHCKRYLILMDKMNERCFSISSKSIQTIMTTVAMFPDLTETCQKILEGFAELAETQTQLIETAKDINTDIGTIQQGYLNLLGTLMISGKEDITAESV